MFRESAASARAPSAWTLRVSVLDRCQYRCPYCRPGAVAPYVEPAARLTVDDYATLAPLFAAHGVSKVRFTGDEPLLRRDLPAVVSAFRRGAPEATLALTTNGQHLRERLPALVEAGITRATVHVDSLRPERYRALMGDGDVGEVLAATLAARELLAEVKLNVVVQRGHNDDELKDFLAWSRATGVEVRFIELMNTGSAADYTRSVFMTGQAIAEALAAAGGASPIPRLEPSAPAARFRADDGLEFGIIASDTQPFCADCNRMRLSADGRLLGCLYESGGLDLRPALAASDGAGLVARLDQGFAGKRSHHPDVDRERVPFSMAQTGG
jgi:GTP 3',8-cyclase